MRVEIDGELCTGHGRCYAVAPRVFASKDDGYGMVVVAGDVPTELEDEARRAVANCPEQAIRVVGGDAAAAG